MVTNHQYRRELIEILGRKPGRGVPLSTIARQVYNSRASLFCTSLSFQTIYLGVGRYLRRQSKRKDSLFIHTKQWGHYALRRNTDYPRFL